jgi:hypothetical protein
MVIDIRMLGCYRLVVVIIFIIEVIFCVPVDAVE